MYNEDDKLFVRSMRAVQHNIDYLCSKQCPFSWGPEGWKDFLVVIVSDGRQKVNARTLAVMEVMGIYNNNLPDPKSKEFGSVMKVNNVPVAAHIYEFTTQKTVNDNLELENTAYPTQVIFVLKEKNAKKINSHKWFFNAICATVVPDVTMLVDVGTRPSDVSLYHLYHAFDMDAKVGGACGEIKADLGGGFFEYTKNLLNPVVAAQNFEYKMSNILDKPLESVFGYISVLPGAFSAYRYQALLGRPLEQYFAGENPLADIFTSNKYLAEDRILCFELVTKKTEAYCLKYVKQAVADTDVPGTLDELVSQRRRWLNGSFFCSVHALQHFYQIYQSPHSAFQRFLFTVEFIYNAINLLFTWFAVGCFYLSFYVSLKSSHYYSSFNGDSADSPFQKYGEAVFSILNYTYLFLLFSMFVTALGNRPRGTRWLYRAFAIFFGAIMCGMLYMTYYSVSKSYIKFVDALKEKGTTNTQGKVNFFSKYVSEDKMFRDTVVSLGSTYGLYWFASILHLDPWHLITCFIQYLIILPTYLNVFMIYSFTNLHDVSWGTKGSTTVEEVPSHARANTQEASDEIFGQSSAGNERWNSIKESMVSSLRRKEDEAPKRSLKEKNEDATKTFRTKVVLFWMLSNVLLIIAFSNPYSLRYFFPNTVAEGVANPFLTFLYWSVAALAFIRLIGCIIYMSDWWFEK
ncbi:chitin synthase-domain-containing protein [Globomyces pollinis-pini]|nr:chitin synthase-domain-containing protein [Globomyces pollinis-pini]